MSQPDPQADDAIPEVIASRRLSDGYIGLRVDTLRRSDGATHDIEVVEYKDAVVIVPIDDDGHILMVRQYRHPARQWLLEMPAGSVDDRDASPEEAAQRELREETGHRGALTRIGGMYLAPGYSEEYQTIFAADHLVEDALEADEDEDLRLEPVLLANALGYVESGRIRDAKSIAALLMYLRHINGAP